MDFIGILQFGKDHSLAQMVRELGFFSQILTYPLAADIASKKLKGVLISGAAADEKEIEKIENSLSCPSLNCGVTPNRTAIKHFLETDIAMEKNWSVATFAAETKKELQDLLMDKRVICALSGGVDSTVVAKMLHEVVGDRLTCIFVDTGLMRHQEKEEVIAMFTKELQLPLLAVDAADRFLENLAGVSDPEKKRKIIGEAFIRVFEETAATVDNPEFFPLVLAQGTIYPDVIESGIGGHLIKSHHNVGGLPEDIDFTEIVEPIAALFKSEVRALGAYLGIPDEFIHRQPFPGPGLALRVLGEITKERLGIARAANFIVETEIKKAGLTPWQYFAILTDIYSVGMVDGKRTYGNTIALRAVSSEDAMLADVYRIPYDILEIISHRITTEIKGITRVVLDITKKPPATIEWE